MVSCNILPKEYPNSTQVFFSLVAGSGRRISAFQAFLSTCDYICQYHLVPGQFGSTLALPIFYSKPMDSPGQDLFALPKAPPDVIISATCILCSWLFLIAQPDSWRSANLANVLKVPIKVKKKHVFKTFKSAAWWISHLCDCTIHLGE